MSPQALADKRPAFADPRLDELLFRYRARNFPETLHAAERAQWQEHCADRLCEAIGRRRSGLRGFAERIGALEAGADERGRGILARAARPMRSSIAPRCARSALSTGRAA